MISKSKARPRADLAQYDRVFFAAVGHVVEGDVGDVEQQRLEASFDCVELALALLDAVAELARGGHLGARVLAGLLLRADRLAGRLALGAHGLDLGHHAAALLLDGEELVERRRGGAPPLQGRADLVGVRTHHLHVEHGSLLGSSGETRRSPADGRCRLPVAVCAAYGIAPGVGALLSQEAAGLAAEVQWTEEKAVRIWRETRMNRGPTRTSAATARPRAFFAGFTLLALALVLAVATPAARAATVTCVATPAPFSPARPWSSAASSTRSPRARRSLSTSTASRSRPP